MKATVIAPSNIAFIKYWGKRDEKLRLPANGSISMNLSNLTTITTVEFNSKLHQDDIIVDGLKEVKQVERIIEHLNRVRKLAKTKVYAKVFSENNFPQSTGLSSSASGFAALTLAAVSALGLKLSEKELTILSRQASGSACRSIPDGFVEWLAGTDNSDSYAHSLYPPEFWDIVDIVAIVGNVKKTVATTQGQKYALTSPFFETRLKNLPERISEFKKFLKEKNFSKFGGIIEREALEMHAIILTSVPPVLYWLPETVLLMLQVRKWRNQGLEVYFSINTGHDLHLLCQEKHKDTLFKLIKKLDIVQNVIINKPAIGARLTNQHLF